MCLNKTSPCYVSYFKSWVFAFEFTKQISDKEQDKLVKENIQKKY